MTRELNNHGGKHCGGRLTDNSDNGSLVGTHETVESAHENE